MRRTSYAILMIVTSWLMISCSSFETHDKATYIWSEIGSEAGIRETNIRINSEKVVYSLDNYVIEQVIKSASDVETFIFNNRSQNQVKVSDKTVIAPIWRALEHQNSLFILGMDNHLVEFSGIVNDTFNVLSINEFSNDILLLLKNNNGYSVSTFDGKEIIYFESSSRPFDFSVNDDITTVLFSDRIKVYDKSELVKEYILAIPLNDSFDIVSFGAIPENDTFNLEVRRDEVIIQYELIVNIKEGNNGTIQVGKEEKVDLLFASAQDTLMSSYMNAYSDKSDEYQLTSKSFNNDFELYRKWIAGVMRTKQVPDIIESYSLNLNDLIESKQLEEIKPKNELGPIINNSYKIDDKLLAVITSYGIPVIQVDSSVVDLKERVNFLSWAEIDVLFSKYNLKFEEADIKSIANWLLLQKFDSLLANKELNKDVLLTQLELIESLISTTERIESTQVRNSVLFTFQDILLPIEEFAAHPVVILPMESGRIWGNPYQELVITDDNANNVINYLLSESVQREISKYEFPVNINVYPELIESAAAVDSFFAENGIVNVQPFNESELKSLQKLTELLVTYRSLDKDLKNLIVNSVVVYLQTKSMSKEAFISDISNKVELYYLEKGN